MKPDEVSCAAGVAGDAGTAPAEKPRGNRGREWIKWVAAAVCICLILVGVLGRIGPAAAFAIAQADYPEMARYPDETAYVDPKTKQMDSDAFSQAHDAWWGDRRAQLDRLTGYSGELNGFFTRSTRQFLSGGGGENRVCSPLNIYMALSMLAELTDGQSRGQILSLLGAGDIETLREQAGAVWNSSYCDDGAVTSILANSLWLSDAVSFERPTFERLARDYYASSYRGDMGSADFTKALQDWLNKQTGGLLAEQAANIELTPDTIMALCSTVYFRAKWHNQFHEGDTAQGAFHAAGGDVVCDFMYQSGVRDYYWGEKFAAVAQPFEGSGAMWLILPDEGVPVDELLADDAAMALVLSGGAGANSKRLVVNLSMPKFDVVSDMDLIPGLKELGVTDVFDSAAADFTPMTRGGGVVITQASHAARVTADEEGCTAAAYTVMMLAGADLPPDDEVDFVLDRPFMFVITGASGLPMFTGIVNTPA